MDFALSFTSIIKQKYSDMLYINWYMQFVIFSQIK